VRLADARSGESLPFTPVPIEYVQVIADHHRGIAGIGMRSTQSITPHIEGEAEWLYSVSVTPGYFRVLGIRPVRGRLFDSKETASPGRVVMLSYECWQRRFGGDERIVGRSMKVGSGTKDIVGVLPRGFVFPSAFVTSSRSSGSGRPDCVTAAREPVATSDRRTLRPIATPGGMLIDPIVRLKPGVTREQAQAEMDVLVAPVRAALDSSPARAGPHSGTTGSRDAMLTPVLEDVRSVVFPTGRRIMTLLVAAAALVLLVGCANLAIMLLARTRRLEPQIGIQIALGATRSRIVRPVLIEAVIIGLSGALVGLVVASLTFDLLLRQVPPVAYGSASVGIDLRVAAFALSLGLISGLLFGVLPAWRATRLDVQALIQRRGNIAARTPRALAHPLVTIQVALAILLVFAAAIAGRAFASVLRTPLGFAPDNVVTLRVDGPLDASELAFYQRAIDMLARRADVVSAGAGRTVPLDNVAPDDFDDRELVGIEHMLPGYLETIGARRIRGRLPSWDDVRSGAPVCVVSQSAARALFPGVDPMGRTVRAAHGGELSIVGVVADVRKTLDDKSRPSVFALPDKGDVMVLVARLRARDGAALTETRRQIARLSPRQPVTAAWWADTIDALVPFRNPRFQLLVLGTFAVLALGLTALGIFAVVSFVVATRTREIGVRLALGAPPGALVGLMVRQALGPVIAGAVLGIVASRWLSALIAAQLFAVDPRDPATLAAAVVTVVLAAMLAAYLPARDASRVDPVEVLRAP
jgi:putative ABC transport system permease protein